MKKIISFIAVVLSMIMLCSAFGCGGSTRDGLLVTISDDIKDIEIQIGKINSPTVLKVKK